MLGGRRGITAVACVLGVGASPAGAGGTDGDAGPQPTLGVTYAGTAKFVKLKVAATAPAPEGGTQIRVTVSLECSKKQGAARLTDTIQSAVEPNGRFEIDAMVSSPPEGGSSYGRVQIDGEFADESSATATVEFSILGEDDDSNIYDDCDDVRRDLDLAGGDVDPGLALVEAAIPVAPDPAFFHGITAVSSDAVFAATHRDGFDRTENRTTAMSRIDPSNNEVVEQREVPGDITALAAIGDTLFGVDSEQGVVLPIDPVTLRADDPIDVTSPNENPPSQALEDYPLFPQTVVADGALWLTSPRDQELIRVDPVGREVAARYPMDARPSYLAAGAAGLYVGMEPDREGINTPASSSIARIDPATGAIVATSQLVVNLDEIVASDTEVVFYDAGPGGGLRRIDPISLAIVATSPAELDTPLVAAPPGIWVSERDDIVVLDAALVPVMTIRNLLELSQDGAASAGFGAVWIFDSDQQLVYRIATF